MKCMRWRLTCSIRSCNVPHWKCPKTKRENETRNNKTKQKKDNKSKQLKNVSTAKRAINRFWPVPEPHYHTPSSHPSLALVYLPFYLAATEKPKETTTTTKVSKGCSTCALKLQVQLATRTRGGDSHLRFMGAKPRFMAMHPPPSLLVALLGALAKRNSRPPHALWPLRFVYPKQLPPKLFSTSLPLLPLLLPLTLPLPLASSPPRALPVRQFVSWSPIEWAVPPSCGWHFDSAAASRATPSKLAEIEAEQLELGYHTKIYSKCSIKYIVYTMYHKSVYMLWVFQARA